MEVELHDGTVLEFPDGTDMAVVKAAAKRYMTKQAPATPPAQAKRTNPITRFAEGALQATVLGPFQLGTNIGDAINPYLDKILPDSWSSQGQPKLSEAMAEAQRGRKAAVRSGMDEGEWDVAGGLGGIAGTAGALPGKVPASLLGRMGYGAGTGAFFGATAPQQEAGLEHNAEDAALGAAIGGAIPAVAEGANRVGKVLYHAGIEPLFEKGRTAIKGRAYLDAAGDKADEVAAALRAYQPAVPGSIAPAGEAAAPAKSTRFAAFQDEAAEALPDAYLDLDDARHAARLAQVRTVGQDDDALKAAEALRSRNAAKAYGAIEDTPIAPQADDALIAQEIARTEAAKAAALQDSGRFGTMAAQQRTLARGGEVPAAMADTGTGVSQVQPRGYPEQRVTQNAYPREGLPMPDEDMASSGGAAYRNRARAIEAQRAAGDARQVYDQRRLEESWLRDMRELMARQSDGASRVGLDDMVDRPSVRAALDDARQSALESGRSFPASPDEPFSVANLQDIKESLDRGIAAAQTAAQAGRRPEVSAEKLTSTRDKFISWLEYKSPEWGKARKQYSADSAPINQMRVGRFLEGKLTDALDETAPDRAKSYANALRDAPASTVRRVTGTPRFQKLTEMLTPEQLQAVESVKRDLAGTARYKRLAEFGRKSGARRSASQAYTESVDSTGHTGLFPQLIDAKFAIANNIIRRLRGLVNEDMAREIAEELLNPATAAEVMENAIARRAKIERTAAALRSGTTKGAALAGSAAARAEE